MKRMMILSLTAVVSLAAFNVNAHPPSKMEMSYDQSTKSLHVEMRHTTHDPREDYIRKLVITVNDKDPLTKRYNIQPNTLMFSDDIMVMAEEGDSITVKAYSKEGGTASGVLMVENVVTEDESEKQAAGMDMKKDKSTETTKGSGY